MTEAGDQHANLHQQSTDEVGSWASSGAPVTGETTVDQALAWLEGLETRPLSEHHDRLVQAHDQLQALLNPAAEPGS